MCSCVRSVASTSRAVRFGVCGGFLVKVEPCFSVYRSSPPVIRGCVSIERDSPIATTRKEAAWRRSARDGLDLGRPPPASPPCCGPVLRPTSRRSRRRRPPSTLARRVVLLRASRPREADAANRQRERRRTSWRRCLAAANREPRASTLEHETETTKTKAMPPRGAQSSREAGRVLRRKLSATGGPIPRR